MPIPREPAPLHLHLTGALAAEASASARHQIAAAFAVGVTDLVIDLRDVEEVDPTGLGVLAGAARHLQRRGGQVRLVGAPSWLASKLRVNGLGELISSAPPRLTVLQGDAQEVPPTPGTRLTVARPS